ncbi:replication-relaxation family protein [Streptomyces sp. NPDC005065]|uniref:replication-relaxation family protein n=1 Tax=Streptomyces sp. NPDC005065 TaxID=3154461 RepID=UPI0033AD07E4
MGRVRWPFGSTARSRALVLQALGVVKVATAEQLRQLVLAGTADAQTVRNACKDLRGEGLVESVGSSSRPGKSGQPVTQQLWNLTTAGLAAAAAELDRPVREMGGTAREAAKAGAARQSVTMCRLRPPTFFPPSQPRETDGTEAAAFTDCASMIPAVGSASRPSRSRTCPRSRSWNSAINPCSRQRRKKA